MQDLYTAADLNRIHAQLVKRLIAVFSVCAVLLAVCVYSLVVRIQVLTIVSVILIGAVLIFCVEMFCRPVYAYEKLIRSALQGRSHTETLIYDHPEPGRPGRSRQARHPGADALLGRAASPPRLDERNTLRDQVHRQKHHRLGRSSAYGSSVIPPLIR